MRACDEDAFAPGEPEADTSRMQLATYALNSMLGESHSDDCVRISLQSCLLSKKPLKCDGVLFMLIDRLLSQGKREERRTESSRSR